MIRSMGQWFDLVKGVHVPRTLSLFDIPFPQLSSKRAVREWRGYAKEELGVEHQVMEGKIGIVDSAGAYTGVKYTTGVTKVVRHDGLQNHSLIGKRHFLLYDGDDAYDVLAEKGKRLNDIAIKYLKPPLLHVGAKRKIHDLLHINLNITVGVYYYTVQRHGASPEDLRALRQWMFDELGITVNSKKRQNKKQDAVSIGQKKEFFIGAKCVKLIAQYDKALEHFRETCPTVSASDDVKAQTAWEICKHLWELLLEPVDPARAPGTAQLPPLHCGRLAHSM
eukprot:jgi/Tetstr1/443441/TSEL_031452.t1